MNTPTPNAMKDTEWLTYEAFLQALDQSAPLPLQVLEAIEQIADSLKTRMIELDALARRTPELVSAYLAARLALAQPAAERSLGPEPATDDEEGKHNREITNATRRLKDSTQKNRQKGKGHG